MNTYIKIENVFSENCKCSECVLYNGDSLECKLVKYDIGIACPLCSKWIIADPPSAILQGDGKEYDSIS
jgi:hypothetical protein